jgi:hypothetical protein
MIKGSVFERILRLTLAGIMFATLFLRWNPLSDSEGLPTWMFIFWILVESNLGTTFLELVASLLLVLGQLSVPILCTLNICLAVCSSKRLRALYRISVVVLFCLTGYWALHTDPGWRGLGFWVNLAVVFAAALIEVILVAGKRLGKSREMHAME